MTSLEEIESALAAMTADGGSVIIVGTREFYTVYWAQQQDKLFPDIRELKRSSEGSGASVGAAILACQAHGAQLNVQSPSRTTTTTTKTTTTTREREE